MNAFCPLSFPSAICNTQRREGIGYDQDASAFTKVVKQRTYIDKGIVGGVDGDISLGSLLNRSLVSDGVLKGEEKRSQQARYIERDELLKRTFFKSMV
jgi:hypothetical protein